MIRKISLVIVASLFISSLLIAPTAFCQNQLRYSLSLSNLELAVDRNEVDMSRTLGTDSKAYLKTVFFAVPPLAKVTKIEAVMKSNGVTYRTDVSRARLVDTASGFGEDVAYLYFEQGRMRNWNFVNIHYAPFALRNAHREFFDQIDFTIWYDIAKGESPKMIDSAFDSIASKIFANYADSKRWYKNPLSIGNAERFDFLIVLSDSRLELATSDFVRYKEEQGFRVNIVSLDEITSQSSGSSTEEKIRNYIKNHYLEWGTKYVMLVGDVRSLPMCYMYPEPNETRDEDAKSRYIGRTPTDFFYAELDSNRDYDEDKLPGEFEEDTDYVEDFYPDVFVGRIPFDEPDKVSKALNNAIKYEKSGESFRKSALLVGAMLYYAEEGMIRQDGALGMNFARENYLEPSGFSVTSMYEKEGTRPSTFESNLPLTNENFTSLLKQGRHGLILLNAHGSPQYVARKYWTDSNGNGKVDSGEIKWIELVTPTDLNGYELSPSVFYFASCETAWPERNSFSKATLARGAAAFIGASRVSYGGETIDPILENFTKHFVFDNFGIGDSLWISLFEAPRYQKSDFVNLYDYNLYGDPSLRVNNTYSIGVGISAGERSISIMQGRTLTVSLNVFLPRSNGLLLGYSTDVEGLNCQFSSESVNSSQEVVLKIICDKTAPVGDFTISVDAKNAEGKVYGFPIHVKIVESKFGISDLNQDGLVNEEDLLILKRSFGSRKGDVGYNPAADINQDGVVNGADLVLFALEYR